MVQTSSSQSPDRRPGSTGNEHNGQIVITCPTCDAAFTLSPAAQSLQLSTDTLETVFMSVCHFCFRCRRPACPECWDGVHGLCGACVQEANLPFRVEAAPLDGAHVQRTDSVPHVNSSSSVLLCVRHGHLQSAAATSSARPCDMPANAPQPLTLPGDRRDARAQKAIFYIPVVPLDAQNQEAEQEQGAVKPLVRFAGVVEQLATTITFGILLVIVVMIVLAELSTAANEQIIHLFHIDIRGEIAYLTYLVRQLHW